MASQAFLSALAAAAAAGAGAGAALISDSRAAIIAAAALASGAAVVLAARWSATDISEAQGPRPAPRRAPEGPVASDADRAVIDALPIGLMIVGPDRTIRFANRIFGQMFARPDAVGSDISILRANRLAERIDAALGQQAASSLEFNLTRAGDAWLKAHISPLPEGGAMVAVEDETQRRRADEVHRDFVANASHELKTPLAACSGIIETLLGHARTDPEAGERFLGLLQNQVGRMARLIDDLMSLNRIEMNARVPPGDAVKLADVIDETVDALTPLADRLGISLTFRRGGADVDVTGDRDQLAQVFTNLVDNALKYSGAGTTVRIHAEDPDREPGMVGIVVQDQGIGIGREHLPRLTERFYRVNVRRSRQVGGTGLGLAIVKHILNRHRGRLAVDSEQGKGTTFTVWLPTRATPQKTGADRVVMKPSQN